MSLGRVGRFGQCSAITHELNHDLDSTAHTINCVCHSIKSMFRVLGIYNFGQHMQQIRIPLRTDNQDLNCTVVKISKLYPKIMKHFFVLGY